MAQNNLLNIKNDKNKPIMIKEKIKEKEKDKEYNLNELLEKEKEEDNPLENYSINNNEKENNKIEKTKTKIIIDMKKNVIKNQKIIEKSEDNDNNSFSIFKHISEEEANNNISKTINNDRMIRDKIFRIKKDMIKKKE